jgi:hypothetical protein
VVAGKVYGNAVIRGECGSSEVHLGPHIEGSARVLGEVVGEVHLGGQKLSWASTCREVRSDHLLTPGLHATA